MVRPSSLTRTSTVSASWAIPVAAIHGQDRKAEPEDLLSRSRHSSSNPGGTGPGVNVATQLIFAHQQLFGQWFMLQQELKYEVVFDCVMRGMSIFRYWIGRWSVDYVFGCYK
ncbi:hypothetical protein A6A05_01510 [Magnetospirillum moscoviense]|uniref:Uncharacterized protein n=1 Tax=Magnetospirillum moscoviense TaxID=1437059 RepID=A0A178MRS4_9PROT|nr:hypothetical protein A6A05_01510 [Magnetospirillum moscoviense]